MTKKENLLRQLSAVQFVMWEIHLYLDTHPTDKEALSLHEKYQIKFAKLKHEYEECFGPLSAFNGNGFEWLKNPWPWDNMECDN